MVDGADEGKRDIWVLGFRDTDERPEKALGRVFGIDSVRARRLIASMPAVVKREVTTAQAEPIIAALRKIGARVALVPTGSSRPPGKRSAEPAGGAAAGLGDIESRGIDFGPSGPPSSGSHPSHPSPPLRTSAPSERPPPPRSSAPPERAAQSLPPPEPVRYLEPCALPEPPPVVTPARGAGARAVAVALLAAGAGAVFLATLPEGTVFGERPDAIGAACAAGAVALLLLGVQALVAAFVFGAPAFHGAAVGIALVLGAAVGGTAYGLHRVDPAEAARRERAATMSAIREGRLPEARLFLTSPGAELLGMPRATASQWVDALYEGGARQVYVMVDYDESPDRGTGLAISLPLTRQRRASVAATVRQQVPGATMGGGEWWFVSLD